MLKKITSITLVFSSLLILPGCFGGDEDAIQVEIDKNFTNYQSEEFSISVPKEWDIIEEKDFSSKVAKNTLIVFRNNLKNDVFTANINIIVNQNKENQSSSDIAKEIINSEKSGVYAFKELAREEITLRRGDDEVKSDYIVFEGKNSEEEDLLRYAQTFLANEEKIYIITGSSKLDEEEKNTKFIETALKSFSLK